MGENTSINKSKKKDGYCYDYHLSIEEIENGFLVTKTISKYPDPEKGSDYPEPEGRYESETKKKYYKTNPLDDKAIWDKVEF